MRHQLCSSSLALLLSVAAFPTYASSSPTILVPAYFYPGAADTNWSQLTTAAGQVKIQAILNPASGPDTTVDVNYSTVVGNLQAAGGSVVGYVHTSWGTRSLADVKAEISTYLTQYPVNGIFLDEMATSPDKLNYYGDIYSFIKSKSTALEVIGNPGTTTDPGYSKVADSLVSFENSYSNYAAYQPAAFDGSFAAIAHTAASAAEMQTVISTLASKHFDTVYVTDLTGANPYSGLPSYWNQEVAAVAAIPEPEMGAMLLAGLGIIGFVGRNRRIKQVSRT